MRSNHDRFEDHQRGPGFFVERLSEDGERQFLFRLCLALGVEHPNRLTLTNAEVMEWWAYFTQHPFGDDVGHSMLAKIMCMFAGKNASTYMPRITEAGGIDHDMAEAEAFLQEEIRLGNC